MIDLSREQRRALRDLGWRLGRRRAKRPRSIPRRDRADIEATEETLVDLEASV